MSNKPKTVETITIQKRIQQYWDIIEVCEFYMPKYGSSANTIAVLVRGSPEYKEWQEQKAAGEGDGDG